MFVVNQRLVGHKKYAYSSIVLIRQCEAQTGSVRDWLSSYLTKEINKEEVKLGIRKVMFVVLRGEYRVKCNRNEVQIREINFFTFFS